MPHIGKETSNCARLRNNVVELRCRRSIANDDDFRCAEDLVGIEELGCAKSNTDSKDTKPDLAIPSTDASSPQRANDWDGIETSSCRRSVASISRPSHARDCKVNGEPMLQ